MNRRNAKSGVLAVAIGTAAIAACGGSRTEARDASDAADAPHPAVSGEKAWADKSREERLDWMGLEVFPRMKSAFTEHDGEGYAEFACQTCHGDDMEAVDFKMPNALFALPMAGTLDAARDYDAETTEFMMNVVVPEMAKLLGTHPYDPETKTGVGCFTCHPTEE